MKTIHFRQQEHQNRHILAEAAIAKDVYGDGIVPASHEMQPDLNKLMEAIDKLPSKQREAFLLMYRDGLTSSEIATIQNANPGAIKENIREARKSLQRKFPEFEVG